MTADFGFLWLCRFAEDVQDFEEFMAMLWTLKTLCLLNGQAMTAPCFPGSPRAGVERPQEAGLRNYRRAPDVSGREVRDALYVNPIW